VATSEDQLVKNKAVVTSFLKGLLEGAKYVRQNRSEMIAFIKGYLRVPEDEAEKSYEFLMKEMPPDLIPGDAPIRTAMEFARHALKLSPDAVPDISKVRDWSFAEAAR
jgi:ABC-type nitrate/sulfonate/bicarbonate transport system substrate-binding protein